MRHVRWLPQRFSAGCVLLENYGMYHFHHLVTCDERECDFKWCYSRWRLLEPSELLHAGSGMILMFLSHFFSNPSLATRIVNPPPTPSDSNQSIQTAQTVQNGSNLSTNSQFLIPQQSGAYAGAAAMKDRVYSHMPACRDCGWNGERG